MSRSVGIGNLLLPSASTRYNSLFFKTVDFIRIDSVHNVFDERQRVAYTVGCIAYCIMVKPEKHMNILLLIHKNFNRFFFLYIVWTANTNSTSAMVFFSRRSDKSAGSMCKKQFAIFNWSYSWASCDYTQKFVNICCCCFFFLFIVGRAAGRCWFFLCDWLAHSTGPVVRTHRTAHTQQFILGTFSSLNTNGSNAILLAKFTESHTSHKTVT